LLLWLSRSGPAWWIPTLCTALAILAMSTRLFLHPATVSCFFLACTLWFLWNPVRNQPSALGPTLDRDQPVTSGVLVGFPLGSVLPPLPLLLVFVVWVNVDRWFLLGLATVALTGLGQILDSTTHADKEKTAGRETNLLLLSLRLLGSLCLLAAVC